MSKDSSSENDVDKAISTQQGSVTESGESRKLARGRYMVKPVTKTTNETAKKGRGANTTKRSATGAGRSSNKTKGRGTGHRTTQNRTPPKKRLPDDPDHQWLKTELRSADTVAQVLGRQGMFDNKIRALKLRHEPGKPLYLYAERMEAFLKQLKAHPWTAQLRDLRQDDPVIRRLKL